MIDNDRLKEAIEKAKVAAAAYGENRDQIFTAVLIKELLSLPSSNQTPPLQLPAPQKILSLQEVLNEKKPKNEVQKTLLFGYYLEKILTKNMFTTRDIEECYRKAKEQTPPNISDKVKMNVKRGLMMSMDNKVDSLLTYTLTNTGLKAVEAGFE